MQTNSLTVHLWSILLSLWAKAQIMELGLGNMNKIYHIAWNLHHMIEIDCDIEILLEIQ